MVEYDAPPNTTDYGADFNADRIFYTTPVTEDPRAMRTVELEKHVAALNGLAQLQADAAAVLAGNEQAAQRLSEIGKTPEAWLRKYLKLPNAQEKKAALAVRREEDGSAVQFNPDKTVTDFAGESNRDQVYERLYHDAQGMGYKVDAAIRDVMAKLEAIKDAVEKVKEKIATARQNYTNLTTHASELDKVSKRMLRDVVGAFGGSKRKSSVRAQLRVLDQTGKLEGYGEIYERLLLSPELSGKNLVEVLELAANLDTIDFSLKADEIRKAMRESGMFKALTSGDKINNARLAVVIAIAKSNPRMMAELELRRLKEGRAEIEAKLDALIDGKLKFRRKKNLTRADSIEDRLLNLYAKEADTIKDIRKNEETYQQDLKALELVNPVVLKRIDELTGEVGAVAKFVFRDGAEFNAAEPGMTDEEVFKAKDKVVLDSDNNPTKPEHLKNRAIRMKEFLMEREQQHKDGNAAAKGRAYQMVAAQYQELGVSLNYRLDEAPGDRSMFELYVMPVFARIGDAFYTPAAQLVKRTGYHFARVEGFLRNISDGLYDKDYRIRREIFKIAPKLNDDTLQEFINSAKVTLEENTADLVEVFADQPTKLQRVAYQRVQDQIMGTKMARDLELDKVADKFMAKFEELVELEYKFGNEFFLGQVLKGIEIINPVTGQYEAAGLKVSDPKIKVLNERGEMVDGLRRHFKKGWRTFGGRRVSVDFNQMAYAMRKSNWAAFQEKVGGGKLKEAYLEDPESAREMLAEFFNNSEHGTVVQELFFRMLAEQPNQSVFDAPGVDEAGSIPAEPAKVIRALNEAEPGDLVEFAETLFDLHDGDGEVADYLQSIADRLGDYWNQVDSIAGEYFPDDGKTNPTNSIKGMSPEALIDSREIDGLPSRWFTFYKFDKPSLHRLSRMIAAEVAFGRKQEYLASLMDTVAKEVADAKMKLEVERQRVRRINPAWDKKKVEKEVAKMPDYKRLSSVEQRSSLVRQSIHDLSTFFRKENNPEATIQFGIRFAQTLSRLMVNAPASAIYQMAALFDNLFRYGVSKETLKATGIILKRNMSEVVSSLAQGIGMQIWQGDHFNDLFNRLNLQYAERVKRFGDEFQRWDNESAPAHAARLIQEVTSTPINLSGKEAQHVLFRPTGLFDWMTMVADKAITEGTWRLVSDYISRGIEFRRNNPDLPADYKLTIKDLKGSMGSEAVLNKLRDDLLNFGMDYDEMVNAAMKRNDGRVFTDEEALRLHSMAMTLISSQSNIATMTPAAWNNTILQWVIPLLGWAFRRTLDVTGKRLDENGKWQAAALGRGMVGIAAATVGGLALSALVDRYYEDIIQRKRNLAPMTSAKGIIEHAARAGSTGLFGEFVNGLVNVHTGGDSRVISLDRRVVVVSSMMGIQSAISNMINQGGPISGFDYSRVGRPLMASLGGNGMLQYMNMANRMLSLDNAESRINSRINAQNYLRVVGRELELSVRKPSGGTGTATPMTPYITRMEMAAYANNAYDFKLAYDAAIKKARIEGHEDPVDHVKRAFSAKNPLRVVFQTPPSQPEYNRILLALPEDGRAAVQSAVDHFNRFAESIGARAFEGKADKKKVNPLLQPERRRAAFREAAFGF
jgi:hypothetical protein